MDSITILRGILEHSQGDAAIRALKALRRKGAVQDETLWRIVRQAMAEPESQYPDTLMAAMQEFDRHMSSNIQENKTTTLQIRLTVNERNMINLLAQRNGLSVSEYVRRKCLD